ncbi:MAG: FAD-binding oxidoreductase, partial [Micromonosporaceae bacterium]
MAADTGAELRRLREGCREVRPATGADSIGGVAPRFVALPGDTDEVSGAVRAAAQLSLSVVVRGSGTRQHWGAPPETVDLVIDMSRMDAVISHAAGDLVVKAQAGLPLADLQAALAPSRQRLALDPPAPGGTVGGVIATAASGPLRHR